MNGAFSGDLLSPCLLSMFLNMIVFSLTCFLYLFSGFLFDNSFLK